MQWIDSIRDNIWSRTKFENQMIPSTDALHFHWKRTCWIMHMWNQTDKNTITLTDMNNFGWKIIDKELTIVWDSEENISKIQTRVIALLKGCRCTTGCATGRCGCKKKDSLCSEGCECVNCKTWSNQTQQMQSQMT